MKFKYIPDIIVFGVVLPLIICAVILITSLTAVSAVSASADEKLVALTAHRDRLKQIEALDKQLLPTRGEIGFLKSKLAEDIQVTANSLLDRTISRDSSSLLTRDSINFPMQTAVDIKKGPNRAVEAVFSGRFDAMQTLALKLETACPQLELASFSVEQAQSKTSNQALTFNIKMKAYRNQAMKSPTAPQ